MDTPSKLSALEISGAEEEFVQNVSKALSDMTIKARLEFVSNMLSSNGGDRSIIPQDARSILLVEIIDSVIEVLKHHPTAAGLRHAEAPEPRP